MLILAHQNFHLFHKFNHLFDFVNWVSAKLKKKILKDFNVTFNARKSPVVLILQRLKFELLHFKTVFFRVECLTSKTGRKNTKKTFKKRANFFKLSFATPSIEQRSPQFLK